MELNFKETVGLYILLKNNAAGLSASLSRLLVRIEKNLNEELTLAQLRNIEDFYRSLDDYEGGL